MLRIVGQKAKGAIAALALLACVVQTEPVLAAGGIFGLGKFEVHSRDFPQAVFVKLTDPNSPTISEDGIQMAESMGVLDKLKRLSALNEKRQAMPEGEHLSLEQHVERSDLRFEILEAVEETRLEMDFIVAEIEEEQAILNEAMRLYSAERDDRVNRANLAAFRTNGLLWAVAEGLDIPTYRNPQLSIPSGAVGIVAGIVPSIFSVYATRALTGGHYSRKPYPNILSKIYDFPVTARIEYPRSVWQYLNSVPSGETRTRRQIIHANWLEDTNIHIFKGGSSQIKLRKLTGNEPYVADLDLISDKLLMMDQIRSVTLQMSRPLLEICMVARGKKRFVADVQP